MVSVKLAKRMQKGGRMIQMIAMIKIKLPKKRVLFVHSAYNGSIYLT